MGIRLIASKSQNKPPATGSKPPHPHHWGRRLLALVLLVAIVAVATTYIHYTDDEQIRKITIQTLEAISGGDVEVGHANLSHFSEIQIKSLNLFPPALNHENEMPFFATQEALIRLDPLKLLRGQFVIHEIVLRQGHLNVWYDRDAGTSNVTFLTPSGAKDRTMVLPEIYLRNCVMAYQEIYQGKTGPIAQEELTGHVRPISDHPHHYAFRFEGGKTGVIQQAQIEGTFDLAYQNAPELQLQFQLQKTDPNNLPLYYSQQIQTYRKIKPTGDVTLNWTYTPKSGQALDLALQNASALWFLPNQSVPLKNIDAMISLRNQTVNIQWLRGIAQDHCDFHLNGTVSGLDRNSGFDLSVGTENFSIPKDQWQNFNKTRSEGIDQLIELLPANVQHILESLSPTGDLDITVAAKRPQGPSQPLSVSGRVQCHRASVTYEKFPYPVKDIFGTVQFSPNDVVVGPLVSQTKEREITYKGHFSKEDGPTSFDMSVAIKNLSLDETLHQALPPNVQTIWNKFKPQNQANATYRLSRKANENSRWEIDVDLLGVDATYEAFPLPVTNMHGTLAIRPEQTEWLINSAQAQDAQIDLSGTCWHQPGQKGQFECDINYAGATLNERFFNTLPEVAREVYHPFTITGKSDGRVAIRHGKIPSPQKLEYDITAHLHQGYVNHTESDYPLEKVEAQIHLTNDRFTLHTLEAQHDSSTIKMAGHLSDPNDYRLHVETQNLHMDQPLRKLVQQVKPELWDMLSFSGDMNLLLDIEQTHALTTPLITGTLEPINASLRLAIIDYPFENIQGKIIIDPNRLIFDQIQGEINSGHFSFSGLWPRNWHDLIELQFQADKIVINDAFLAALPESMTDYFQRIELEGQLKTDLKVSGQNDPDKKGLWNVNGSIQLHQGKIISPMLSETIDLLWKGSLSYQSQTETLWAEGDFQEGSALIKKRPLEKFQAKMAYNNESNILQLSDIKAEFCEGLLGGNAQVSLPKDGPGYELQLVIRDADLKLFLESEKPIQERRKKLQGRMEGQYHLSKQNPQADRIGSFQCNVREAVLGELPFTAKLLHIPNLSIPKKEGAFNEVEISGNMINQTVIIDRLWLKGSAMALDGMGEMTEPGHHLNVIFLVGSPHDLTPIPGVTQLLTIVKPMLIYANATGPFDAPNIRTITFAEYQKLRKYLRGGFSDPLRK